EDRFREHLFTFVQSQAFAYEAEVPAAGKRRRSENHSWYFFEETILQQPRNIDWRCAQENATAAPLQPVNEFLIIPFDYEAQREAQLPRAPQNAFSIRWWIFENRQRRFQTIERLVERVVWSRPCPLFVFRVLIHSRATAPDRIVR